VSAGRTFQLTVAYDGSAFHGWQKQPGLRTVQGELERAAAEVFAMDGLVIHGAGRTDAGVHARGQGASLTVDTDMPPRGVRAFLERALPADVRVPDAIERPAGFHARHSARGRRYTYRLLDVHDVLYGRFAWTLPHAVDGAALAGCTGPLLGTHDFSAFEAKGSTVVNPVCRVTEARWSRWDGGWQFDVSADHFLYHMVRNLVGTSLRAQRERDPAAHVAGVLASRDRSRAGATVPAHGLCLESVTYQEDLA